MQPAKASKRSKDTCSECRARKVRCDSRRDVCGACERLNLSCSFQRADGDVEATPERRRARAACEACHALKARCTGEIPKCNRCRTKGISCIYPTSKRTTARSDGRQSARPSLTPDEARSNSSRNLAYGTHSSTADPPPSFDVSSLSLDDGLVMRMFEAFFQHIHPIPLYSFFHKASLVQRYEAGLLDSSLVLAVIGMTCQLLEMGPGMRDYGAACLHEAEALVMKDFGTPSVIKIQALILIIRHHAHERRFRKAFMLFATATRFAYALRLNHEAPNLCFLAQESRRRLMWSLYIIDTTMAGGARDLVLCSTHSIHIQLPCQERNFEFDLRQETEPLQPKPKTPLPESIGSLGMYVRLLWLRHRILQITKDTVLYRGNHIKNFPSKVRALEEELADFENSLPQSFRFSEKNLLLRAYSPRLCPYLLVHVWYRQLYCDLYRVTLTGLAEALPPDELKYLDNSFLADCRRKCLANATALAEVFRSFKALRTGCPVMESEVFVCAYQCSRLIFHCQRQWSFELGLTDESAKEMARHCLEALHTIPLSCPTAAYMEEDLRQLLDTDGPSFSALSPTLANSGLPGASRRASAQRQKAGKKQQTINTMRAGLHIGDRKYQDASDFAISNAFQGAFDGLHFDDDTTMATDPFSWFTGYWASVNPAAP